MLLMHALFSLAHGLNVVQNFRRSGYVNKDSLALLADSKTTVVYFLLSFASKKVFFTQKHTLPSEPNWLERGC